MTPPGRGEFSVLEEEHPTIEDRYDPVRKLGEFWYFYDETWANEYGPYDTEEEARKDFAVYCENML